MPRGLEAAADPNGGGGAGSVATLILLKNPGSPKIALRKCFKINN